MAESKLDGLQATITHAGPQHGKVRALGTVAVFVLIGMVCSANTQTPADDVAAQVRAQGYRCDQPVTAKRDVKLSKPDSAVWILKCNKVTFRVRLDPDMAAQVKKLN